MSTSICVPSLTEIAASQITGRPAELADIRRYMGQEWAPRVNWCAGFVAWCLAISGYDAPYSGPARRGARALIRWLASESGWVIAPPAHNPDLSVLRAGDVVCWRRVRLGWQCHVAIVEDVRPVIRTIGGNERGQVRRAWLSPMDFKTRSHGLYGVARPQTARTP